MQKSEKRIQLCDQLKEDILSLYTDVVSIILYGSGATEEYDSKKSDLNFLVVLTEREIEELKSVQKYLKKWKKMKISLPVFMTESYIQGSLDSFPIEFLNMQSAYQVIYGKDVLAPLKIDRQDLRLQCEREIKSKLLQLRQGYITTEGRTRLLKALISQSIVSFVAIFRGLLVLKNKQAPVKKTETILAACDVFDEIDRSLYETLLLIRHGEVEKSKPELETAVQLYIQSIDALSGQIDRMEL